MLSHVIGVSLQDVIFGGLLLKPYYTILKKLTAKTEYLGIAKPYKCWQDPWSVTQNKINVAIPQSPGITTNQIGECYRFTLAHGEFADIPISSRYFSELGASIVNQEWREGFNGYIIQAERAFVRNYSLSGKRVIGVNQ